MITFDQWLDIICRNAEPEANFDIQADVHASAALIEDWKQGNLTNAQIIEAFNFDNTDPELSAVKTHLNSITRADALALQSAMILAENKVSVTGATYDKAELRARFGL